MYPTRLETQDLDDCLSAPAVCLKEVTEKCACFFIILFVYRHWEEAIQQAAFNTYPSYSLRPDMAVHPWYTPYFFVLRHTHYE